MRCPPPRRMGRRQILLLVSVACFVAVTLSLLRQRRGAHPPVAVPDPRPRPHAVDGSPERPAGPATPASHPISKLVEGAEAQFDGLRRRQSRSLEEAVAEYRRRYGLPPPPNFDRWYEFATTRDVQMIDEYDGIYDSLAPFWGLGPATVRARTREALGFDNALMGVSVRGGRITLIQGGQEWQQKATTGMTRSFVAHLPDMDLAFNIFDEPRVVVPYEDLDRLVEQGKSKNMPAAYANEAPRNAFSPRPGDMNDGRRMVEFKTTRFNRYAHQPTWVVSKMSCAPETPARALEDQAADDVASYATGELGFVHNVTAFSDVCQSPSLRSSFGFFDRPNAFDVVHELFPVFSQSKVSSFQDILYPSPWYWYGKVTYNASRDVAWEDKASRMYWRGSTTGGFSRDGGWRRQHRQKLVQGINARDKTTVLERKGGEAARWEPREVSRRAYARLFNVSFSHVGQCDPADCDAQREFFSVAPAADQQEAWRYAHLLDVDGNAFSGRFYAFLRSNSLVHKVALFREWHAEWLRPWVHYVPLSLRGNDVVEAVRFLSDEDEGRERAARLARAGQDWAGRVLRNEDFEAWLFRLLLEYGRVIDDERARIGYAGPRAEPPGPPPAADAAGGAPP
ncbi:MAG: capsule-associated protein CAP1 [Thelocarpon impressellum]|nr:MAG: capsule-associated protein CAP1 [Thelocarpon impressellum]